jgi:hypothetical protein
VVFWRQVTRVKSNRVPGQYGMALEQIKLRVVVDSVCSSFVP